MNGTAARRLSALRRTPLSPPPQRRHRFTASRADTLGSYTPQASPLAVAAPPALGFFPCRRPSGIGAAAVGLAWEAPVTRAARQTPARRTTCGCRWQPIPNNVLRGRGGPACSGHARVTPDGWEARAAAVGVVWLDQIRSRGTPTPARCTTCGYRWEAKPSDIACGFGCPTCSGRIVPQSVWDERAAAVGLV
jgi:hypothetical protein